MIPLRIEGATRYLGAPAGWTPPPGEACVHLAIVDTASDGGTPLMISAWEPTPDELAALNSGGAVYLWICGTSHPMVALTAMTADQVEAAQR